MHICATSQQFSLIMVVFLERSNLVEALTKKKKYLKWMSVFQIKLSTARKKKVCPLYLLLPSFLLNESNEIVTAHNVQCN